MPNSPSTDLQPAIIVIFGITGDLSQRYLLPALYHLIKDGLLHPQSEIVGITRRDVTAKELLDKVALCVNEADKTCDPQALAEMHRRTRMVRMEPTEAADYRQLLQQLNDIEAEKGMCMNRLYYLSIPPQVYGPIIKLMGATGLNASCPHGAAMTRLLVEKPFGYDLESAEALITETGQVFGEEQIYRIDHYLAKETVQNILTFRFGNPIFEALWNREHISRIEISASEAIGIEGRAQFYEATGALRDFIQSHLLQVLAIITMDKPTAMDSEHIHDSKQAVLNQVIPIPPNQVDDCAVRGQYEGYRDEVGNADSAAETFAGIRVTIDSERWREVPVILWTGKALEARATEITVTFDSQAERPNHLRFRIQPNEGIQLDLLTKKPGFATELQTTAMDFSYQKNFGEHDHPNAYERVLVDAVRGDHTLFATSEEVLAAWRIIQPLINEWSKDATSLRSYPQGADGRELVEKLLPS
jgi:glucose-6-phosphate 1-dehydrogenase